MLFNIDKVNWPEEWPMDFDGFRLEFADWWFNIRPSNTEPYLRFICEARTEALLQEKVAQACKLLESRFGAVRS